MIESTPRSVRVNDFTVHARGNDLDDLLGTMARVAPVVHGDPTTDAHSAAALIDALRAPSKRRDDQHRRRRRARQCVITTSLGLGSGVWVPGYGVHLNSMMGEGELVRGLVHPGSDGLDDVTLIALDDHGQLAAIAGAAGGSRIRPALVQCVCGCCTAPPQDAIDAPRLLRCRIWSDWSRVLLSVIRSLEATATRLRSLITGTLLRGRVRTQSRWRSRSPPRRRPSSCCETLPRGRPLACVGPVARPLRLHSSSPRASNPLRDIGAERDLALGGFRSSGDDPILDLPPAGQSQLHLGRCGPASSATSASSVSGGSTSSILQSTTGSDHGYDTTDVSRVDQDRGGAEALVGS